jgi:multidrug efflux pump subunit AcrB
LLVPWLGQNFFPSSDNGQFILHLRAKSGTRIEETARLCDLVETSIRRQIPARETDTILDNIGLPYSTINFMHSTSGLIGTADADIMVSLKEKHQPTAGYVRQLRKTLPRDFPGVTFYFLPADMVTQVLNFGRRPSTSRLKGPTSTEIVRWLTRCSASCAEFPGSLICAYSSSSTIPPTTST